jgi:hypothetical protein
VPVEDVPNVVATAVAIGDAPAARLLLVLLLPP